jgi:DNA-directed RNA polymerase sigma subunit (sigma70/sigma32)
MKLEVILQKLGLLQTGKIMYIGGSDVLPAPLKPEQERQAVAALEQGDEAAKQTLIEHNLRLVAHIAKKYYTQSDEQDDQSRGPDFHRDHRTHQGRQHLPARPEHQACDVFVALH